MESREKLKAGKDHTQLSLISLQKDLKACHYQMELLEKSISEMSEKMLNLSRQSERRKERVGKNKTDLSQAESLLESSKKAYEEKVQAGGVYEKAYQAQVSRYKELENQISELNQNLGHTSEQKHSVEVEQEALTAEKKNLEEKTLENYQTSLSQGSRERTSSRGS